MKFRTRLAKNDPVCLPPTTAKARRAATGSSAEADATAEDMALLGNWLAGPGARPTADDRKRWAQAAADEQAPRRHFAAG